MARDGTYRGGRRPRAGERPAPLAEKIAKGKPPKSLRFQISYPKQICKRMIWKVPQS